MSTPNPATTEWVPLWSLGTGRTGFGIPGEIKLWSGKVLPDISKYGLWVWADGAVYDSVTYPDASVNIAPEWKTAHGQVDPGAGKFRVPDLRGLVPVGMDTMPGGTDGGRLSRATPIAGKSGEEYHVITTGEMPNHAHTGSTGGESADHAHYTSGNTGYISNDHTHNSNTSITAGAGDGYDHLGKAAFWAKQTSDGVNQNHYHAFGAWSGGRNTAHTHAVTAEGGGGAHETLQPSVFVPYIVRLDS